MRLSKHPNNPESEAPQTTLAILQLTRFGDLIQTSQAIEELKKAHPEYRIILIARSQFARPLGFILNKLFDKTYYLDTKKIFQNSEIAGLKTSINGLNQFLSELSGESIKLLVNLSFSSSSSYLSSLIKAEIKIGSHYDFENKIQKSTKN